MKLAASSTWATEISKLVVAELHNATNDRDAVRILCTVAFKSRKMKKEHREALNKLRDESQRTIYMLDELTNRVTRLQATKAARDKIDDSFWDNSDLELAADRGEARFDEYKLKADDHISELMSLMRLVALDKRLKLLGRKNAKQLGERAAKQLHAGPTTKT